MKDKDLELLKETSDLDIIEYLIDNDYINLLDVFVTPNFNHYYTENNVLSKTELGYKQLLVKNVKVNNIIFDNIDMFIKFLYENIENIIYIYSIRKDSNKLVVRLYINLVKEHKCVIINNKKQIIRNNKIDKIFNE